MKRLSLTLLGAAPIGACQSVTHCAFPTAESATAPTAIAPTAFSTSPAPRTPVPPGFDCGLLAIDGCMAVADAV